MPAQHQRPVFIDNERTTPNTPSPFDDYMQQLNLLYPAKIVSLSDGLSTMHIRHPRPEWLDSQPGGRPPTPEWAKTCSPFTPERPHQLVPDHPAFQRPDLRSNHQQKGAPAAPYDIHLFDGYRMKCAGADVPPWYGPEFRSAKKGSVEAPVVPPFRSPGFSTPGYEVPTIPPLHTRQFSSPIEGPIASFISSATFSLGHSTGPTEGPFIPPSPSYHDERDRTRRDDSGRHSSRRVQIRSPPVSHTWIPELLSSSVSTASASSSTPRGSRDTNAHIIGPGPSSSATAPSTAQASSSTSPSATTRVVPPTTDDHRDRERSLLQKPRRSVSDLKLRNPKNLSPVRPSRKKAVCIGISYQGQRGRELRGCVNDANTIRKFLMRTAGYESQNIIILTEETGSRTRDSQSQPTYNNIHRALRWLVEGAQAGDSFFLFFSGHGERIPDKSGDEVDGYDKAMVPVDHMTEGYITDDDLHHILVRNLPKKCRLTAFFDACHSGTMLDLPYVYSSSGNLKGTLTTRSAFFAKCSPSDTVSWSSCRDRQTSADTYHNGRPIGAMTHAWVTTLTEKPQQTYKELLGNLRQILRARFVQKPLLSASHVIDTDRIFVY
ncbi:hypothetical protein D9619_003780 [Psilocybe cf. subviscida]|uniref:Peptidase C14 caspase domain-containing protein n=1 Tax=Psilocybe cf. subviscida TaxID=2480587 RepID=A0A8H5AVW8_9AGAR|nr:hypothetical protein D9619_003780 [Psilocybe cf. subviscida]